ncbi:hypothetical protein GCM10007242_34890 [Pigmentiphaga litoralis]|nr:hypothetical protein GCM10007242_34890 [Pigmentiphaga litoralis]
MRAEAQTATLALVGHSDRILQTVQRETGAPDSSKGRAGIQAHSQETNAALRQPRPGRPLKPNEAEAHSIARRD